MKITTDWIVQNYRTFNNKYWEGKLPMIKAKICFTKNKFGEASCSISEQHDMFFNYSIKISNYYDRTEEQFKNTLLHEMIHIADYSLHPEHFYSFNTHKKISRRYYDSHGPVFFEVEAQRLSKDGWMITRRCNEESELSERAAEKEKEAQMKREKPYMLVILKMNDETVRKYSHSTEYFAVKIQQRNIKEALRMIQNEKYYSEGIVFETSHPRFRDSRCSTKRGYFVKKSLLDDLNNRVKNGEGAVLYKSK